MSSAVQTGCGSDACQGMSRQFVLDHVTESFLRPAARGPPSLWKGHSQERGDREGVSFVATVSKARGFCHPFNELRSIISMTSHVCSLCTASNQKLCKSMVGPTRSAVPMATSEHRRICITTGDDDGTGLLVFFCSRCRQRSSSFSRVGQCRGLIMSVRETTEALHTAATSQLTVMVNARLKAELHEASRSSRSLAGWCQWTHVFGG